MIKLAIDRNEELIKSEKVDAPINHLNKELNKDKQNKSLIDPVQEESLSRVLKQPYYTKKKSKDYEFKEELLENKLKEKSANEQLKPKEMEHHEIKQSKVLSVISDKISHKNMINNPEYDLIIDDKEAKANLPQKINSKDSI